MSSAVVVSSVVDVSTNVVECSVVIMGVVGISIKIFPAI